MNKKKKLTQKQENVFSYICQFIKENNFPPSYKEIKKAFNFSSDATVRTYLEYLEKNNLIQRSKNKSRSLKVLSLPKNTIPVVGSIAAGIPSLAIQTDSENISDLSILQCKKNKIALKVKGDSMIEIGIINNDYVIIEKDVDIKNKDIVAVLINNEATLKRIHFKDENIELIAENKNYKPIILKHTERNKIIGKYIGLIREN